MERTKISDKCWNDGWLRWSHGRTKNFQLKTLKPCTEAWGSFSHFIRTGQRQSCNSRQSVTEFCPKSPSTSACVTVVLQRVMSFESRVGLLEPRDWSPPFREASWSLFYDSWNPQGDKRGIALAMTQIQNISQWLIPCLLSCELTGFELLTPCLGPWAREWIN